MFKKYSWFAAALLNLVLEKRVAQVSKPAVSPISKSAGRSTAKARLIAVGLRVWKPALPSNRPLLSMAVALLTLTPALLFGQAQIDITQSIDINGWPKPVPVSISGFSGEGDSVLKNDLLFIGIAKVSPDQAKYLITGNNASRVEGRVTEKINKHELLAKAYAGGSMRSQTHALADDIAMALTGKPGIAQTKVAFKGETHRGNSEIYIADYDGHNPLAVTHDQTIAAAPCWGGRSTLYYASYKLGAPKIFSHHLTSGARKLITPFPGANISPAVSPDGNH